ncbi:MAG: type II toxin-antitoxin system VapC family toxin [Chloracidobacterium sp.]|nr:type II toxin-antitoxin system VapC family toxin [Chloracidobacterium sp.]MCO5332943.1 type II toxin-antitoxin system VapC family toxin [Pyrinomonadaceae bacterium]
MMYLLDTCVISEIIKPIPELKVVNWIKSKEPEVLFLSVFTISEIMRGIERLDATKRRSKLEQWLDDIKTVYKGKTLDFDIESAEIWGKMRGRADKTGAPISPFDSQIAAIAIKHGLIIATRNINDFDRTGVELFNPWAK